MRAVRLFSLISTICFASPRTEAQGLRTAFSVLIRELNSGEVAQRSPSYDGEIAPNPNIGFPAKYDFALGNVINTLCDNGDMALFNGLLCASREQKGCDVVKDGLDMNTGHWWSSPAIKLRNKVGNKDCVDQPNLNSDQALGAILYVLQRDDARAAFRAWMHFIGTNGPCKSNACLGARIAGLPVSVPRNCGLKGNDGNNCMFKPNDCLETGIEEPEMAQRTATLDPAPIALNAGNQYVAE
jgi:hypothetical protein